MEERSVSKIRVITVRLPSIARSAERLEIHWLIRAPLGTGNDVVYFKPDSIST